MSNPYVTPVRPVRIFPALPGRNPCFRISPALMGLCRYFAWNDFLLCITFLAALWFPLISTAAYQPGSALRYAHSFRQWTTHCLKPMGFLLRRPRNLLSPQALIRTVPVLYCYSFYAICLNPSSSIFFAALISLSWFVPQTGHIHSLTDRFFVSVFWYPQAEHSWLLA